MIWFFLLACIPSSTSYLPHLQFEQPPEVVSPEEKPLKKKMCTEYISDQLLPINISKDDPRLHSDHLILILKKQRLIAHYNKGKRGQDDCWPIGLGFSPAGHKQKEGDGKTPVGWYKSSHKPKSKFYGAIAIHYPNSSDAKQALTDGRIDKKTANKIYSRLKKGQKPPQSTPMGGEILIHGGGSGSDWTLGCVAMNNPQLDALHSILPKSRKAEVLILP